MEKQYYYAYSKYLKEKYGEKVYKLPVNLPVTCPNRKEGGGCLFCADAGTGFEAKEMLGMRLCVLHNLYFYNTMMSEIRQAIEEGNYKEYKKRKIDGMMNQ